MASFLRFSFKFLSHGSCPACLSASGLHQCIQQARCLVIVAGSNNAQVGYWVIPLPQHRVCTFSRCSSESIYPQYSSTPLGRWSCQQINTLEFIFWEFWDIVFFNLLLSIQENDGLRPDRLLPAQHRVQQHLPQHKIWRAVRQHSDSSGSSSGAEPVLFGFGPSGRTDATPDR